MPDIRSQLVDWIVGNAGNILSTQEAADAESVVELLGKLGGFESKESIERIKGQFKLAGEAAKSGNATALQNAKAELEREGNALKRELKFKELDTGVVRQKDAIAGELGKITARNLEERKGAAQAVILEVQKPKMVEKVQREMVAARNQDVRELIGKVRSGNDVEQALAIQNLKQSERLDIAVKLLHPEVANMGEFGQKLAADTLSSGGRTLTPDKIIEIAKADTDVRELTPAIEKLGGNTAQLEASAKMGRASQYAAELESAAALKRRSGIAKKGLIGGAAAIILPLLAMSMFGKGKKGEAQSEIPPMLQMQLAAQAQQMQQGSDQADGRALLNLQRAMNIIKTLQGFSGLQGGQAPATAGLL